MPNKDDVKTTYNKTWIPRSPAFSSVPTKDEVNHVHPQTPPDICEPIVAWAEAAAVPPAATLSIQQEHLCRTLPVFKSVFLCKYGTSPQG
ncbi:hypothetical protein E2C01_074483 [Portunus trituberculatus]|uniref:Uncharacterized protein n=1 Tax=Portunus trituberculatus TaxID=210409 RepID=A0A5B7IDA2_PORTR|nr:hypothetical protein [Portunus trituberculatus]